MKKILKIPFLALLAVILSAGYSFALTVDLAAVEAQWTPPDGSGPVAMWAFIADPGNCTGGPYTWDVGPVITVPSTDNTVLTINLRNCLAEGASVFIPGQMKATSPVTFTDGQGRTRVSSFDSVVAPDGTGSYTWNNPKEGTYLYQSGTFVAKQVPKGLYGALVVEYDPGTYPVVGQEEVLLYSEIDPVLNNSGAGARINNYQPKYFLINGETYPNTGNIDVTIGTDVLLRFVNAGLQTYVPTLQGVYMSVIAEDGNLLPYPLTQYQLELTAAKTMDAIVNIGADGRYALYDRSLHMADTPATNGGMLTFIQTQAVAANNPPVANPDTYFVPEGGVLTVTDTGVLGDGVLVNDTDADSDPLTAYQTGIAPPGALILNTDGTFTYTPAGAGGAVETFQYYASDSSANSLPATVTINVTYAPIANNDAITVPRNITSIIDIATQITANDVDPDVGGGIDPATVVITTGSARGATVFVVGDGTISYTPEAGGAGGPDSFGYTVNDVSGATSNEATVRVRRIGNAPPTPGTVPNNDGRGRTKSR